MSFSVFLYFSFLLFLFNPASSRQPPCHESERSALLWFKESLSIDISVYDSFCYPKTSFWNPEENSDCCSWNGVDCKEDTGYVIKLDLGSSCLYGPINSTSTLFNLVHLQWLSLADNHFQLSEIPYGIKNLSKLSHLNLSDSEFSGQIPSEILELSKLESLDLSGYNNWLELQQPSLESLVQKLTNLRVLDLHEVYISSSLPNHVLTDLSSLNFLSLANCRMKGTILSSLGNLKNLIHLDLSGNNLWGTIPSSIYNLTNLVYLSLWDCNFSSLDPDSSLSKNTKLTHLDLSYNNIGGEIPLSLMNLNQLLELDLSFNQLSGHIPSQIGNLTQLESLYLSSNKFQGSIPSSIFELNNLDSLYLYSNNLSGTIELQTFLRLKSLSLLDISSNHLSLLTNFTVNTSSHKFQYLGLGSCNLRSFPDFLRHQDQLAGLDLSSNNISGQLPRWLFNLRISNLNLSHNMLTGFDQQPDVLPWTSLYCLDLSFNKLQGPLPIISPRSTFRYYLVSSNNMSGELSPGICKLNFLQALDLSNNNFSGELPQCLGNFSHRLSMLNLQNNKFNGSIPQTFMNGTKLRMIDLSSNMFGGKIPRSLANCTMLEFLDLGNNKINDAFPSWIGSLPNLVVLNLQSNKLYGAIEEPKSDFEFPKLQIIDLSDNRFTGKLPSKYFECWNAMKVVNVSQLAYMLKSASYNGFYEYDYSLTMMNKGIKLEYVKIPNMLVSISLSNNKFEGEIPASISILQGLRYLNLSNNNLVGGIPSSLDNLTVLESLDLSNNNLSEEIPSQMVKITTLAFFNVSYNNFIGPIPHGAQFDTFNNMSYEGNPGLCGLPLSRKCGNSELTHKEDDEGSESPFAFCWKVVAIGYASGLVIGVVLGHIFCTKKYEWFVKIFGMSLKKIEREGAE